MHNLIENLINAFNHLGYLGVGFLMAMESSIFPLPSELVIPPAAYLALRGEMNVWLIILAGTIGSIVGATVTYWVSLWLGRAVIYSLINSKLAKAILLNKEKLEKAEKFFNHYGGVSVFIGRLLPVIRHLISIPAGFCKMNFGQFVFYTAVGSFIWVSILAWGSYLFGKKAEMMLKIFKDSTELIMALCFVVFIITFLIFFIRKRRKKNNNSNNKLAV
jgi:membrane protein DedA with SNARE-associated domain